MEEPKEVVEESIDTKIDTFLDKGEKTPAESSDGKKTTVEEPKEPEVAGDDQPKKSTEGDEGKETEKDTEEKKEEDPKDLAFREAYNKGKSKSDKDYEERLKGMPSKEELEAFKQVTSSPEFIRESMRAKGFKDEAIDSELKRMGHTVQERPGDDVTLVTQKLGLDPNTIDSNMRSTISDVSKIVRIIANDAMGKVLPEQLKPLQEAQLQQAQKQSALDIAKQMEKTVQSEGILDFKEDIQPAMNEFLDKNPNATQGEAQAHFREVNHALSIERLKSGKKKEKRDVDKTKLRSQKPGVQLDPSKVPAKSGNVAQDIDSFLDHVGMTG